MTHLKEVLFQKALAIIQEHELAVLRETKLTLIAISSNLNKERNVMSQQTLKTLHNRRRAAHAKTARIAFIDEKLLPDEVGLFQKPLLPEFIELKQGSILRIRRLLKEKERLTKLTNEHDLKSKSNLRSLRFVYMESQKINEHIQTLDAAESIRRFFQTEKINPYNLTDAEKRKLYNTYIKSKN